MSDHHTPQRRDKRYRTLLPVRTRVAGRVHALFTEDVSYRGLFAYTETPPPVRQLIRIEAILPPDNIPFATHGMVVYAIGKGDASGRRPGIGVQFYGMGDERRVWERYIQFIQSSSETVPDRRNGASSEPVAGAAPPAPPAAAPAPVEPEPTCTALVPVAPAAVPSSRPRNGEPPPFRVALGSGAHENRRFHRFPIVLEVRPVDLEELVCMYSRDVSVGGMFLPTAREIPVGNELRLEIRHPYAEAVFPMTAVVRRRSEEPLGIGVEFVGLDDRRRRQFFEFIHAPLPATEAGENELREGE